MCNFKFEKKTFKELILVIFFPKHANMPQLMTKFVRTWNMCLLNLARQICKIALFGQRNLIKLIKTGTKLAL
jgi:hypothetical protein